MDRYSDGGMEGSPHEISGLPHWQTERVSKRQTHAYNLITTQFFFFVFFFINNNSNYFVRIFCRVLLSRQTKWLEVALVTHRCLLTFSSPYFRYLCVRRPLWQSTLVGDSQHNASVTKAQTENPCNKLDKPVDRHFQKIDRKNQQHKYNAQKTKTSN